MATTKRFVARFGIDSNGNSITNLGSEGSELSLDSGHSVSFTTTGPTALTLPTSGTLATTDQLGGGGGGGSGTLTLQTDGVGLSGSQTFSTATDATFTVVSNATDTNTPDTIVSRDASGNFSASTALLTGLTLDGSGRVSGQTQQNYIGAAGVANTTSACALLVQNSSELTSTGGIATSLSGVISAPQASNDATEGTATLSLTGFTSVPVVTSSASTSSILLTGNNFLVQRSFSTDTSSSAQTSIRGLNATYGHASTLDSGASTSNVIGINLSGSISAGSVGNIFAGVLAQQVANPLSGSTVINNYSPFYANTSSIGTGSGAVAVTNYYGFIHTGLTNGTNGTITNAYEMYLGGITNSGTITNKWSLYQASPSLNNYFAGNLLLGSTSSTAGYKLKIADTTPAIRLEETSAGQKRLDMSVAASGVATISTPQSAQSLVLSTVGSTRLVAAPTGISYLGSSSTGTVVANGSAITSIVKTSAGVNYTSFPTVSVSAPTGAGGVQATATVSGMTFYGASPTINTGGTGYALNDVLTVVGANGGTLTLTVTAVSGGGVITSAAHAAFGTVTSLPPAPYSVTGGSGTGATFTSTWQIVSIAVGAAGSGYLDTPTVTISGGGGGSGATATAYIGSMPTITSAHSSLALQTPGGNLSVRLIDDTVASTGVTPTTLYIVSASTAAGRAAIRSNKALYISSATTNSIYFTTQSSATTDGTTQFTVTNTTGAVNVCSITGAVAGAAPTMSVQGSDTSINFTLSAKGTGAVQSSSAFRAGTSGTNYHQWAGATTGQSPIYSVQGSDTNIDLSIATKGTGSVKILTADTVQQVAISHTASAVNYLQLTGGASTVSPQISSQGTDANIGLILQSKSASIVFLTRSTNARSFNILDSASPVNYLQVQGNTTGAAPILSAQGTDTNISISLQPKGTGTVAVTSDASVTGKITLTGATATSTDAELQLTRTSSNTGVGQAPGIRFNDGTTNNTRIIQNGSGNLQFLRYSGTWGTDMTLSSGGNLGLNTTPSTWGGSFRAFELSTGAVWSSSPTNIFVTSNAYNNGTNYVYKSTAAASQYQQGAGAHTWYVAPSGTAGSTFSFTTAMTLDASGNLGLKMTPSTWSSVNYALQGPGGSLFSLGLDNVITANNVYYDGAYKYVGTYNATMAVQSSGQHQWYTAAVGTAGTAITFTQAMTLTQVGNLGIGTAAPVNKLDINGSFGRGAPVTKTADFALAANENWVICNKTGSALTVTLPAAASWTGREIMLKNVQASYGVQSASANVIPFAGGSAATSILSAGVADATLVSNGTAWVITQTTGTGTTTSTAVVSRGVPVIKTDVGIVTGTNTFYSEEAGMDLTVNVYGPHTIGTENCVIFAGAVGAMCELPAAASWPGRELLIKNASASGAVYSKTTSGTNVVDANNVIQCDSLTIPSTGPYIIAGARKWVTLISNGTYWVTMTQGSTV